MRLKSYHSATVESAIRLAHIELGDDAVFLGSRRNDVGSGPNQAYEVTFAVMEPNDDERSLAEVNGGPQRNSPSVPLEAAGTQGPSRAPGAEAPSASGARLDAGAVVSWKKLLRQVTTRGGKLVASGNAQPRDSAPNDTAPAAAARQNGFRARGSAMPHWKEFVPGDVYEPPSPQVEKQDSVRVRETGLTQADTPGPRAAAPSAPAPRVTPAAEPARKKARGMPAAVPEDSLTQVYSLEKLGAELEQLRRMFEGQQAGRAPLVLPSRELLNDTRLAGLFHGLSDNGVEPSLASELVAGLQQAAEQGADRKRLAALLAGEIRRRFKTNSDLGSGGSARAIAAVVGPSGAGKSTIVAKLAFRCGLLRRRPVRLFSVDQLRIGAVESLQAYAELMNTPLHIVDEFDKLGPALDSVDEQGERELVLIDTPGYGRREWERARRLAAAFQQRGDIGVHLVLDLRTKIDDLRRAVDNFRVFRPARLLFTRLDETTTFGAMLNETVRTGLPVSFVSVGQRVPEDIVPAGEPELLRLLLKDRSSN